MSNAIPMVINITIPSSTEVTLPLTGHTDLLVDWGDGIIDSLMTHTYDADDYSLILIFNGTNIHFGDSTGNFTPYITTISQWDNITDLSYACYHATGLTSVSTLPSSVTNTSHMFDGCTGFNKSFTESLTNVTDMSYMFYNCSYLNNSINLTTSSVLTDTSYMFYGCNQLNSKLSLSVTKGVTNMASMFEGCSVLDQIVDLIISSIPSGTSSLLGTGLLDIFKNTGLSALNYSSIINQFINSIIPTHLNMGTVSNSDNSLKYHLTTSMYGLYTSDPYYWVIIDSGSIQNYSKSPVTYVNSPLSIKDSIDPTVLVSLNKSIMLNKSYNTSDISVSGIAYYTPDTTSVTTTYNGKTVSECIGSTLNIGSDMDTVNIGGINSTVNIPDINITGDIVVNSCTDTGAGYLKMNIAGNDYLIKLLDL